MEKDTREVFLSCYRICQGGGCCKINKAAVERAHHLNLGVDEHDTEKLEVVPEELTNEELLELKQEHIAEEGKEKEMARKEKKPQENSQ